MLEALDELTWTEERLDALLREADANRDGKIQRLRHSGASRSTVL